MSPSREARAELHRYVEARKPPRPQWTPVDKQDAVVAFLCAVGLVYLIVFVWAPA